MGAEITEATYVGGFVVQGRRVNGVRTVRGDIPAGAVVLAGGAMGGLLSDELNVHLPVHPVKGEILAVNARPVPIRANVWDDGCYIVPKRDGRVIVGSTKEPGVYDRRPTLGGVAHLSQAAVNLVPELSRAPFASAWSGLRPGTPDGRPIFGPVEGWEGLFLATGHYRNGVLLSAATGENIAALAWGRLPPSTSRRSRKRGLRRARPRDRDPKRTVGDDHRTRPKGGPTRGLRLARRGGE